ncbi:MAG: hypothetical protein A2136_05380 [Chloroflexi bacterium RBG_16_54_11]|nr:MAG: hypothetical protein A2136_05380 [Chloroflexi bacterium RBG_16_54_11]
MGSKPLSSIYSIVEKAYFRLQAGDVLTRCLEVGSTHPIHELIEDMVVAGPKSLEALREMHAEVVKRKSQVYDDLNQVINQLSIILKGDGVNLEMQSSKQDFQSFNRIILQELKTFDDGAKVRILQVLKDSHELVDTLEAKIQLLENIETFLSDWLWGLTFQYIRRGDGETDGNSIRVELQ